MLPTALLPLLILPLLLLQIGEVESSKDAEHDTAYNRDMGQRSRNDPPRNEKDWEKDIQRYFQEGRPRDGSSDGSGYQARPEQSGPRPDPHKTIGSYLTGNNRKS